jgi:hypothetical protein
MATAYTIFAPQYLEERRVFRTIREAKDFVKLHGVKYYAIEKHKVVRLTIDNVLAIINSDGGQWSESSEVVIDKLG